jgi:hypothetical protein
MKQKREREREKRVNERLAGSGDNNVNKLTEVLILIKHVCDAGV